MESKTPQNCTQYMQFDEEKDEENFLQWLCDNAGKGQEEKQNPIRKRASENMRNDRNLALVQPVVHCGTLGVRNTSSFMPDL